MADDINLSYCAQQVRLYDRHRFAQAMLAPATGRDPLLVLYAFNLEIAKVREVVSEPLLGQMRLQWWRDAIEAMAQGAAPPRHAVAEPLAELIHRHALPTGLLQQMVDARDLDLSGQPPAGMPDLEAYAEATAGNLAQLSLHLLDAATPPALNAALHVGAAQGLSGLMIALPVLARHGRVALPADRLAAAGLSQDDVIARRNRDRLSQVVREVCARASARLDFAEQARSRAPRQAAPSLLAAVIARHWLRRLDGAGHDPYRLAVGTDRPPLLRLAIGAMLGRW